MKKALKIIGIIAAVIIAAVVLLLVLKSYIDSNTPIVSDDYQEKTATGGDIEKRFLKNGACEIKNIEKKADKPLEKYLIYYPADMESTQSRYPVIVYSNGSNVMGSQCTPLFKHWASWGFVVIAHEDKSTWSGESSDKALSYLLEENNNSESIFFGKIDLENIGITGHSQGGVSVFNAATNFENSKLIKTIVACSPTQEELAEGLKWPYDLTKVTASVLMFAGTESDDAKTVLPLDKMQIMYDKLNVPKTVARKTNCKHNDTDSAMDGYVTAWLMWQLQNDTEAAKAFIGDNPEIVNNKLYQDQKIDLKSIKE